MFFSSTYSTFTRQRTLDKHIASIHEGIKPFKCGLCEYSSANKDHLTTHIMYKHEGKKPFKCEDCKASFTCKSDLKRHIYEKHSYDIPNNLALFDFTC